MVNGRCTGAGSKGDDLESIDWFQVEDNKVSNGFLRLYLSLSLLSPRPGCCFCEASDIQCDMDVVDATANT